MSPVRLILETQYERVWRDENPSPTTFNAELGQFPLYHQWRTYNATEPLIVNTYNTGTGKTKAALLRLLKRARDIGFNYLDSSEHNALLIVPTNELLAQHVRDAEKFCEENRLPYRVVPITRADLDNDKADPEFSEGDLRRGAALHYILQNPRKVKEESGKKATLFVVNPDIFYYAFYFLYYKHDSIPLFQDIFTLCNYIIIDELHYYTPQQTAITGEIGRTRETPALAPVYLEVYSVDELKDGLLTLALEKKREIAAWVNTGEDGAIISSALWRINQIYYDLSSTISTDTMGRLTGAESRRGREDAKAKHLILATPTVDIGYNFDRLSKTRQNIDFLQLDARSGDEFIQRLGRAGRVLGKQQQDIPSRVQAVVEPTFYKALQPYDGQSMNRLTLRELAEEHLPARNSLYSYINTGAIAEAFLPIYRLESMASAEGKPDIEVLFNEVQQLFAADTKLTYQRLKNSARSYVQRAQDYGSLEEVPIETTDCLYACKQRLMHEQEYRKAHGKLWTSSQEAYNWLQKDLRSYFIEKARFSFREDFQPPLALISDSKGLLSSEPVMLFDALHVVKNYEVKYFDSAKAWQEKSMQSLPEGAKDAFIFCDLIGLREPEDRLQLGLKLSVGNYKRTVWEEEERFAYHPTALYGLEVVALNNDHGLPTNVRKMFSQRKSQCLYHVELKETSSIHPI